MKITFNKTSKIFTISYIVAAMFFVGGCQSMIDAQVRSNLGTNTTPPVISYQTSDPELQTYLTLLTSLEKDLQGVTKALSPAENAARLKLQEENVLKAFKKPMPGLTADQQLALAEKMVDDEKKRPAPYHLSILPAGADAKDSVARVYSSPDTFNERIEQKTASVTVVYKFASIQEMTAKAHALGAKFGPVFSKEQGWQTLDLKNIVRANNLDSIGDPKLKQQLQELKEKNIKVADAGQYYSNYNWASDHRTKIGRTDIQITNMVLASITPSLDAENGKYAMIVAFSRIVAQPKIK